MRQLDLDLNDDPISLEMNQYADQDIDNFIKPATPAIGRGDVFVRYGEKPDETNGSNCGSVGCNAGGS